jgi:hypothetical protein
MAIITVCAQCGKETIASASNHWPLCDDCKRKQGWKPWEEMTLEEKVEDLNKRLSSLSDYSALIG